MATVKSPIIQRDNFPPNSKQPKVSAVRDFPDGCGSLASSTCQSKCEEGNGTRHIQNASILREVGSLSVPHSKPVRIAANIGLGNVLSGTRKDSCVRRDLLSRGIFVSPFQSRDTNNLNLTVEDKLSRACINYEADAFGMSSSTLIRTEQLKDDKDSRKNVKEALNLFNKILNNLPCGSSGKDYLRAARIFFERGKWVKFPKQSGPIPGVQVGDKFQCRAELKVAGLHHQLCRGIDYMKKDGKILATSVVASGRYQNKLISSGILIYSGEGGNPLVSGSKKPIDQKLKRGNLALMNSKEARSLVRVILRFKISKRCSHIGLSGDKLDETAFVYDGLYFVDKSWQERGRFGKLVFNFRLRRILQQPKLDYRKLMGKLKSSQIKKVVVRVNDISQGKERVPIRLENSLDEEKALSFEYITSTIYPRSFKTILLNCCNCVNKCKDFEICACVLKNGGELPCNSKRHNVTGYPIISECGPSCKCSCVNMVTQNGICFQLEVFKAEPKRWGVRSRSYISKGSFVCEYVGEVLHDKEIQKRINNMYRNHLCEGGCVSLLTYSQVSTIPTDNFTIDATLRGNVGRFVNHSDSPNLRAQCVLQDHSDVKLPHVMLFAIKDIPPKQELTLDYSCTMAKFGF
ncbi:histone H3-K9 methyltransferase [Trema orientale]|uniref:Histone H3-K9 methyltransferase n=1 Tax=Trema orientale TaxID=63057 RepID=A0A2P5ED59_TREOI|nr:histone H3-K9 methyltransferase [Trema orientale]